jgi:hypothetical protein
MYYPLNSLLYLCRLWVEPLYNLDSIDLSSCLHHNIRGNGFTSQGHMSISRTLKSGMRRLSSLQQMATHARELVFSVL